ncbi:MAG: YbbR-like domain-containing protein [Deltaproteobacteria bacterium]
MKKQGEDVRLRIISVFIAIVLWIYVVNIQNPEIKKEFDSIPVNVKNVDLLLGYGLIFSGDSTDSISVKLKGNQDAIKKIERNDIEAVADLKDVKGKFGPGKVSIPVKINLLTSDRLEVLEKDKYSMEVELDKYSQIQKPIEVEFQGQTSKDIKYDVKSIRPNVVTISGPKKLISTIDSVKVFVDVTNAEKEMSVVKNFRIFTKSNTDITSNEHLTKDIQNIQIDIDYQKYKEVPIITEVVGQPEKGYYVSGIATNPEKVIVSGHTDKINPIKVINTKKIKIEGKSSNAESLVSLIIPTGININFEGDVKISVGIKKEDTKTIEFSKSDITVLNSSPDYEYKIITSKLRAYLSGKQGALDSVTPLNLGLFIDVASLGEGEHQIYLQIPKNENMKLLEKTQAIKLLVSRRK